MPREFATPEEVDSAKKTFVRAEIPTKYVFPSKFFREGTVPFDELPPQSRAMVEAQLKQENMSVRDFSSVRAKIVPVPVDDLPISVFEEELFTGKASSRR